MKRRVFAHLCFAGIVGLSAVASAQTPAGQTTISGCVISESDYRKMHDAGRGGVVGTGVGAGNEFILTDASNGPSPVTDATSARSVMPSGSSASGTSASGTSGATGTSGTTGAAAAGAMAYELSGSGEGQLSRYVGRRVELTGMFKGGATSAAGQATGGPTAGSPPNGVDVGGKDLKLREFDVASVKEASGTCAPMK